MGVPTIRNVIPIAARAARVCVLVGAMALLAACSSSSSADKTEQEDEQTLVSAAQAAGVAPGLTTSVAESLYGRSAPQICDVLDGRGQLRRVAAADREPVGSPRRSSITTDAVTYERLVVQTYCPDELSTYDDLVAEIDATETTG